MITKFPNGDTFVNLLWWHLVIYAEGRMCWTSRHVAYLDRIPGPFAKRGLSQAEMRRFGWFLTGNKIERFM